MSTRFIHQSLIVAISTASLIGGCASSQTRTDARNGDHAMHTIQVLYFDGCPNTPPVIESAKAVAHELGDNWRVEMINLESLPEDDTRRGYGSPTILFKGKDLSGLPTPTSSALSCRHYPDGNPTGASIRSALGR